MREVSKKSFEKLEQNLKSNRQSYWIEAKRGQRYLFHNGKMVAKRKYKTSVEKKIKTRKEQQKVLSLIANVKKSFTSHIKKVGTVEEIPQHYGSVYTNRIAFRELPNDTELFYIDIKHCYWRIAFILGYISTKVYENNLDKKEMKLYRNMALSCTIAPKIIEIHEYNKPMVIQQEDTVMHKIMYSNIRFFAWNLMGNIVNELGKDKVFGYWTDGILVGKNEVNKVKKIFDVNNLLYRVKNCVKIDDKHYKEIERDKIKKV